MQKTKIIKEIIGTALEPYGFKYQKTEGPCRIFVKTLEGIRRYFDPDNTTLNQYINIQDSNVESALYARISTNAYGKGIPRDLEELKSLNPYSAMPWAPYSDEESFRKCLMGISELLIKYGLPQLEEMSVEDEIVSNKIMEKRLYDEHTRLEKTFLEKYHLKAILKTEQDIDEMFKNIDKIISDSCDKPYEEVKELLMMIAAYYGQRICDLTGAEWEYRGPAGVTKVCTKFAYIPVLPGFVNVWRDKCSEASWKHFDYDKDMLKQLVR